MKGKKPVHTTTLYTRSLAAFILGARKAGMTPKQIAKFLDCTVQKLSAVCRHAKK